MKFSQEDEPVRHIAQKLSDDVSRIVAANPSRMTYYGTNTYLLRSGTNWVVIDPGPLDEVHTTDILAATGGAISGIVLTHHHSDHAGGAAALQAASGASVAAFASFASDLVTPDIRIEDGQTVHGLMAVHTPGHASDHICLALPDGRLFSGDHVMGWATSVVSPPDGNMTDYCRSLQLLIEREDRLYLPGHGPSLEAPNRFVRAVLAHRIAKENSILNQLSEASRTATDLTDALHKHAEPRLKRAAERTITAHLEKLAREERVRQVDDLWEFVG